MTRLYNIISTIALICLVLTTHLVSYRDGKKDGIIETYKTVNTSIEKLNADLIKKGTHITLTTDSIYTVVHFKKKLTAE